MARPKKRTIDYFPHQCTHGKTMFIIEQRYGNDGYAFWFKLLELLGSTNDHYLHLNNPADWEFLQAKTRTNEGFCQEILDLLARLDAIDQELWDEHKVVWSQNFVNGIADAYRNRKSETPKTPNFLRKKPSQDGVSTSEKPQTKLNETILDNTIINDYRNVVDVFNQNIHPITPLELEKLTDWLRDLPEELVIEAIKEAVNNGVRKMSYIEAILNNWKNDGITTIDELRAKQRERGDPNRKAAKNSGETTGTTDKYDSIDFSKFEYKG